MPEEKKRTIRGKVVIKKTAKGSKSESNAICIDTGDSTYVLRRVGGNPFNDSILNDLVGKEVTATGVINQHLFLATEIKVST
ncbi:MAG: hypothetical protein ABIN89_00515 [Chitinophagaceae bacterium]